MASRDPDGQRKGPLGEFLAGLLSCFPPLFLAFWGVPVLIMTGLYGPVEMFRLMFRVPETAEIFGALYLSALVVGFASQETGI